jgi:transposase
VRSKAYHLLEVSVEERSRFAPGRPKKGTLRLPVAIDYVLRPCITEQPEAIAKRRQMAGCFVLLSNVPADGGGAYDAERILRTDQEQHGIEKNFGFLKDDQIVNALFLRRPERIEALGLILLISLLVWRLIERVLRQQLAARQESLPGWDNKPTTRPTRPTC